MANDHIKYNPTTGHVLYDTGSDKPDRSCGSPPSCVCDSTVIPSTISVDNSGVTIGTCVDVTHCSIGGAISVSQVAGSCIYSYSCTGDCPGGFGGMDKCVSDINVYWDDTLCRWVCQVSEDSFHTPPALAFRGLGGVNPLNPLGTYVNDGSGCSVGNVVIT